MSLEEYIERIAERGIGDLEKFLPEAQPAYIDGNAYLSGAKGFGREEHCCSDEENPGAEVVRKPDGLYLEITLPKAVFELPTEVIDTARLGVARIPEASFEDPDGKAVTLNTDFIGMPVGRHPLPGPLQGMNIGKNRIRLD